jgi:replicative DNA helicase
VKNRIPPHSEDAEKNLLGSLLIPNETAREIGICGDFNIDPECFYLQAHQEIFKTIRQMVSDVGVDRINLVTVADRMKCEGTIQNIGGTGYLDRLVDSIVSSGQCESFADIIRKKFVLRGTIDSARKMAMAAFAEDEPQTVIGNGLNGLCNLLAGTDRQKTKAQIAKTQLKAMHDAKQGIVYGFLSFFQPVNDILISYQPANLYVIAAQPSCGKSTWLYNDVIHKGVVYNEPSAIFSLEMSADTLATQMAGSIAGVNTHRMRGIKWEQAEYDQMVRGFDTLTNAPIHIEAGSRTIEDIIGRITYLYHKFKVRFFVVDYLQIIRESEWCERKSRNEIIGRWMKSLKSTAVRLNVPVLVASQLNRGFGAAEMKKAQVAPQPPSLQSLRDSGEIEQDADVVIFLYKKPGVSLDMFASDSDWEMEVSVSKNRIGPLGRKPAWMVRSKERWMTQFEHSANDQSF